MNLILKAKKYATKVHKGQKYNNGKFIQHPTQVAEILKLVTPKDKNLICAGYLHDTIEDTDTTWHNLLHEFNKDIANLVQEVTKEVPDNKSLPAFFPNLSTHRGIMLKFADRLSNLSHMDNWDEKKKQWYLTKSKFWNSANKIVR